MEVVTRRRSKRNAVPDNSHDNEDDETEVTEQQEEANVDTIHEDEASPYEESQPA